MKINFLIVTVILIIATVFSINFLKKDNLKETATYEELRKQSWITSYKKGQKIKSEGQGFYIDNDTMFDLVCVFTRKTLGIKKLAYDEKLLERITNVTKNKKSHSTNQNWTLG